MTTKPKILQTALAAITGELKKVRAEYEQTFTEIDKVKAEIKRLKEMPVSRADFSLLLKEHIAALADKTDKILCRDLTEQAEDMHMKFEPFNRRGMSSLEVKYIGGKSADWIFSYNNVLDNTGGVLANGQLEAGKLQSLLMWLFPDVIHDKIMMVVNEQIGEKWGNDELPTVEEKNKKITDLQIELKDLEAKRDDLAAQLAEFSKMTAIDDPNADPYAGLSESQRHYLINHQ